jgi:ornithine--oxo-acid transaminase
MKKHIELSNRYSAKNYSPLDVVLSKGEGIYVWDTQGRKYTDMLSAYSALNQGHRHPRIIAAAKEQMDSITITSRAFRNDKMGLFLEKICNLAGFEMGLPMNTGAEAVETALKAARKWGEKVKKIPKNQSEIIVCDNNFHGRTISIVSFSTQEQYRDGFGPHTPGFISVRFGSADAVQKAITPNTCAILVEPIQGEGGVIIPPDGYLRKLREIADHNNVLLMFDEIQVGLGRCGTMFAFQHEDTRPDVLILGKALGGGVYPVSIVLSDAQVLGVFSPGDHGSTFGGNPLGAAVAIASLDVILDEHLAENAREVGAYFVQKLKALASPAICEIRTRGLMIGVQINREYGKARDFCLKLMDEGLLCKDTHENTIRFTPPLIITKQDIDEIMPKISKVLS